MFKITNNRGVIGTGTALALAAVAAIGGAAAKGYAAHEERKAAEDAAEAQKEVAQMQIEAVKEQEVLAQKTAQDKLKLAQAKKSKTILTPPGGELAEDQINVKELTGV